MSSVGLKSLVITFFNFTCIINIIPNKYGDEFPIYVKTNSKNIKYDKLINCSNEN